MGMIAVKALFVSLLLISISACTPRYRDQRYNSPEFPIKSISELLQRDEKSFLEVKELPVYIIFNNYNFYTIDYLSAGTVKSVSAAVSKDGSVYYFLNDPDKFSLINLNKLMKTARFKIQNEAQALLYLKFFSKLFLPDTVSIDEVKNKLISEKTYGENVRLKKILDTYGSNIYHEKGRGKHTSAEFYTLNGGQVMYKWEVIMTNSGLIAALKVTVMSISADYHTDEKVVIFDKKLNMLEPKKTIYDPTK